MFVKVCGLGTAADIDVAFAAGADAIGLVISRTSVRGLDRDRAARLAAHVPPEVLSVLVVNDTPAAEAAHLAGELGFSTLQLHGRAYREEDFAAAAEIFPRLWRATSLSERPDTRVGAYGEEVLLLDSPRAGSGESWDLSLLETARPEGTWLLAAWAHTRERQRGDRPGPPLGGRRLQRRRIRPGRQGPPPDSYVPRHRETDDFAGGLTLARPGTAASHPRHASEPVAGIATQVVLDPHPRHPQPHEPRNGGKFGCAHPELGCWGYVRDVQPLPQGRSTHT